jgi:hypothetical protein
MAEFSIDHGSCNRHRGLYAFWIAVVICAGLVSRSQTLALPAFVAKYGGDALWALMIFLGLGFLLPTRRTTVVAGLAVVVSCTVEFSQLYRAPWIDAARGTWWGRLTLGDTFAWGDIVAYLVGIVFGGVIEWALWRARNGSMVSTCPGQSPSLASSGEAEKTRHA